MALQTLSISATSTILHAMILCQSRLVPREPELDKRQVTKSHKKSLWGARKESCFWLHTKFRKETALQSNSVTNFEAAKSRVIFLWPLPPRCTRGSLWASQGVRKLKEIPGDMYAHHCQAAAARPCCHIHPSKWRRTPARMVLTSWCVWEIMRRWLCFKERTNFQRKCPMGLSTLSMRSPKSMLPEPSASKQRRTPSSSAGDKGHPKRLVIEHGPKSYAKPLCLKLGLPQDS